MSNVRIIEKPDDISFECIRAVLRRAHSINIQNGIVMHTTQLSAAELEAYLGEDGRCYVAMDGNEIIGTASFRIRERNTWYVKGKFVDEVLVGVLPEHSGEHIYSKLYTKIEHYARKNGFTRIVFNTAAANKHKQAASLNKGFKYVSFFAAEDNDHYSVIMAKWLDSCPYSRIGIWVRYNLKKWNVILHYKPGKVKRFG